MLHVNLSRYIDTSMMMTARAFCLLLGFLPLCSLAADYDQILQQALAEFDDDYRETWAFTEERVFDGVTTVARFDPRGAEKWQLLSVAGKAPTSEEIDRFSEEKSKEGGRGKGRRGDGSPETMVTPGSLSMIEETEDYWLFDFIPGGKGDNADFMAQLSGEMKISKENTAIEFIDIRSDGAFKPRFGFKVSEFITRMEFVRASLQGPAVPRAMQFRIKARALGMMKVDEKVSLQYRDYQFVGGAD